MMSPITENKEPAPAFAHEFEKSEDDEFKQFFDQHKISYAKVERLKTKKTGRFSLCFVWT